jgi:hypothetical protein
MFPSGKACTLTPWTTATELFGNSEQLAKGADPMRIKNARRKWREPAGKIGVRLKCKSALRIRYRIQQRMSRTVTNIVTNIHGK